MTESALRLVPDANGELVAPGACTSCTTLTGKLWNAEQEYRELDREVRRLRRRITTLEAEADVKRQEHARRREIEQAFEYWQNACGKQKSKLSPERFDALAARLKDEYTVEHFNLASDGAAHNNPWPTKGKKPMVEIETFCRKGSWLEDFAVAGAEWRRQA
jgi:predicted RNase H-like nuclease (RuvC/YqgF family)